MKVKCNRTALHEALQLASSIVPARTPKPILQCAKLEVDQKNQCLTVLATDNEISLRFSVSQVEIEQEGALVIPADRITAILRESTDETVNIQGADAACEVVGRDSRFHIYGHEPDDFPALPMEQASEKGLLKMKASVLKQMIHQVAFAAAKESTRYAINGVLWEPRGKKLRMVATDGRRLAQMEGSLVAACKQEDLNVIVPLKTMSAIERIIHDPDETIQIDFNENHVCVASATVQLSSTLVQGRFPKYEDVIPSRCEKKATLETESLNSAVRRVALLTNEQSRGVQLAFDKDTLRLTSSTPEAGDAEINMPAVYDGDPMTISFNPVYLLDMLRVVNEPQLNCEFIEGTKPGLIRSGKDFLYVIMPVTG